MKKCGPIRTAGSVCFWGVRGTGEGGWGTAQGKTWGEMSDYKGKLSSITWPLLPILLKQGTVPVQPPSTVSQQGLCSPPP